MRKIKLSTIIKIFVFIIMILILMQSNTLAYTEEAKLASGLIDPNDFAPEPIENAFEQANVVVDMGSMVISVIRVIGIIVTVVALMIIGIKFMTASASEKAKVKETLVPYIAGCIVAFGAFAIWKLVVELLGSAVS